MSERHNALAAPPCQEAGTRATAHDQDGHQHGHGLVHDSIKRSREGVHAVALALLVLGLTAAGQAAVYALSGSVALLADLIHNLGEAATAFPLGIAFAQRSARAERWAGLAVVLAIFVSARVAGYKAVDRLIDPREIDWWAAAIRSRAGRRLDSAALVADGDHARADAYVSLAVVASAAAVALGAELLDPAVGLVITAVILRITWRSWQTLRQGA